MSAAGREPEARGEAGLDGAQPGRDDAFAAAVGAIRRRERSRAEIREWLTERGFDAERVAEAIARLEEVGELDDERFARRYAEDKRELRGWGPARIQEALLARGVGLDDVEAALDADSYERQLQRAVELLERKAGELDSEPGRGRALGYLTRRGYDYDTAYEAVRRLRPAA